MQRLLVVDDEEMIRFLYRKELSDSGYQVDTAACGAEAVDKVSRGGLALVILDIELPDMSGLQILQTLRRIAPETPIILNSAYTVYKSDFQTWLADDYVVKSSDLSVLKEKIDRLVRMS